jgi:hypothetical protein
MSLLNLDAQARPGHVAEVIERLTAIAGLSPIDAHDVARAYLISPTLVGHAEELASFHKRIVRAARGRGSSVLVRGAAGLGRSRLLQALVLEAKLSGAQVLSANAEYAERGELGVMRTLIQALCESLPDVALAAFRPFAHVLGELFPGLYRKLQDPPPLAPAADRREQRARAVQALRAWLGAVAQLRPLMIAVDDADHADESSAICLTLLAGDAERAPMVVSVAVEGEGRGALEVLCAEAATIALAPLDAEQSVKLLRSVFGDVPHLQVVADSPTATPARSWSSLSTWSITASRATTTAAGPCPSPCAIRRCRRASNRPSTSSWRCSGRTRARSPKRSRWSRITSNSISPSSSA